MSAKKSILAVVIVIAAIVIYISDAYNRTVDLGDRVVSVIVVSGDTFSSVTDRLVSQGVLKSGTFIRYAARIRGIDRKLTPGRYDFVGRNSCRTVLDKLAGADFVVVRVTIVEGAPIWRVASVLSEKMEIDSSSVIELNTDSTFLAEVNLPCLEGYLFPQTYFFPWGTPLKQMIVEMTEMFRSQTETVWHEPLHNGLSREQMIILASIVEAEGLFQTELAQIASVYHNRIRRRMKLDADPTVIYGLGGLDRPLSRRDLRTPTPYNTYLIPGLPPAPINSPGLPAIRATLYPDSSDYLYFVADGTGKHRFSRTNAEHNRARREIRRNSQGK